MFKLNLYNVKILEKYPRTSIYKYKVNCDIGYFKWCSKNITFDYIDLYSTSDNNYKYFINNNSKLFEEIKRLSKNIKGPDDCCDNMDLELCNSYPLHDMLLDYMLGNEKFNVIDYKFKYAKFDYNPYLFSVGFIKFKYKGVNFEYSFTLSSKVKEYACLNCKTVAQDEGYITDLHNFIDKNYESAKRQMQAKEICMEADINRE